MSDRGEFNTGVETATWLWKDLHVRVEIDDVYLLEEAGGRKRQSLPHGQQGVAPSSHRQAVEALHRKALEEGLRLARPQAIACEAPIKEVQGRQVKLAAGASEAILTCNLLVRLVKGATALVLAVCTLGPELEAKVQFYSRQGRLAEAFALDVTGTALIQAAAQDVVNRLKEHYQARGLKTTIPLGPGHSYWSHLEDQEAIFSLLHPENIGVTLNPGTRGMMWPRKSMSLVMGVGKKLPASADSHCYYCSSRRTCPLSQFQGNT